MRSKKLVIVYAVILFLIVFLITFNSVCAITQIDARFDVSSADAKQKAEKIQDELDGYLRKNFLFFDTDTVKEIFERKENSHFKVLSVEKSFPNKITVNVREKYECYAFYDKTLQKYAVTDASGEVIVLKDDASNNLSGNNVAVSGFTLQNAEAGQTLSVKESEQKAFAGVKAALAYFEKTFGGVRTNIVSVLYQAERDGISVFSTQEGVEFYFTNIQKFTEEMFAEVFELYSSLSDGEKTYGRINAAVQDNGKLNVQYITNDITA